MDRAPRSDPLPLLVAAAAVVSLLALGRPVEREAQAVVVRDPQPQPTLVVLRRLRAKATAVAPELPRAAKIPVAVAVVPAAWVATADQVVVALEVRAPPAISLDLL
jgi:hypothetical protein